MAHEGEFFRCGSCGYVGEESELEQDGSHECGRDKCPDCGEEGCVSCCYTSEHNAEMEHLDDDPDCDCANCNSKTGDTRPSGAED